MSTGMVCKIQSLFYYRAFRMVCKQSVFFNLEVPNDAQQKKTEMAKENAPAEAFMWAGAATKARLKKILHGLGLL